MHALDQNSGYSDRSVLLYLIGSPLLLIGLVAAFYGPLELYVFYLFGEGGRFAYPGFRFGSFMYANLAAQIAGYYAIAALLLPLGYGHLARRRWVRPLALAVLGFWRVLGLPLSLVFLLVLMASKEVTVAVVVLVLVLLAVAYLILPGLLRRFYRSRDLRLTLEARDPREHWLERLPVPILTLCLLYLFYWIVLHLPTLLNGLYPLYGTFLTGLPGIVALDLSILVLGLLAWGTLKRATWAWWGGLVYWGWLTASTIVTFARTGWQDLITLLALPPTEVDFMDGVPLQGPNLALFFGLLFALPLVGLVATKVHFGQHTRS